MLATMPAWYEDDAFWDLWGPHMFSAGQWEKAEVEVDAALALGGVSSPARVLDLPCGTGRHSLALARRGHTVTAVDRTEAYLGEARDRADGLGVEWVREDMRRFRRDAAFDLALNLYSSFGYFEDPADDARTARVFHDALVPGGALVMDLMSKEILARTFRAREWRPTDSGGLWLEDRVIPSGWERLENTWTLVEGGRRHEHRFVLRLYSFAELRALLESVGFEEVTAFGDLAGAPYDDRAPRLVVRARRPCETR